MPTDEAGDRSSVSDHVLLKRFREGEQDAATALYLRYGERLQSLARAKTSGAYSTRFDPEDVVQSVFRTFFRRVAGGLYDVPAGDELWQLLLVIALNKIRELAEFHSAQKRDVRRSTDQPTDSIPVTVHSHKGSMEALKVVIDEFLEGIQPHHAEIARMRMEGYEVNEIAASCQRSKRTVERILSELRKQLIGKLDTS